MIMLFVRLLFMWSMMAARVVDLPLPVVPVTSIRPRDSRATFFRTSGRFSSSMVGIFIGMTLKTSPMVPRWMSMLQRNLPSPGTL